MGIQYRYILFENSLSFASIASHINGITPKILPSKNLAFTYGIRVLCFEIFRRAVIAFLWQYIVKIDKISGVIGWQWYNFFLLLIDNSPCGLPVNILSSCLSSCGLSCTDHRALVIICYYVFKTDDVCSCSNWSLVLVNILFLFLNFIHKG